MDYGTNCKCIVSLFHNIIVFFEAARDLEK